MKTQHVVLAFMSLLLFACPSSDDDSPQEEALFTPTNYIYEGDIRLFYLESENARLNDSIAVWEQVPDSSPDYNDAQGNIAEANEVILTNEAESLNISTNFSLAAFDATVMIPSNFPPLPFPCFCLTLRNSVTKIVLFPGTSESSMTMLVDGQNVLETNGVINNVPDVDAGLKYQTVNFSDLNYEGEATFTFETNGENPITMDAYLFDQ